MKEAHGFQHGGDDTDDDEPDILADPEIGSLLVDRDRARTPPRSPPEPAPQLEFKARAAAPQIRAGPEVTDPLGDVELGPSLAEQFAATTSPPGPPTHIALAWVLHSSRKNRVSGATIKS